MTPDAQDTPAQDQARPERRDKNRSGMLARSWRLFLKCQAERHTCCGRAQVAEPPANHRESLDGKAALPREHIQEPGIWLVSGKAAGTLEPATGARLELPQE